MTSGRGVVKVLLDAVTIVLAVGALWVVGERVLYALAPRVDVTQRITREVPDWRSIADSGALVGVSGALVTVTEFGDYLCPFCKRAEQYLSGIGAEYPSEVAFSYRNYPLDTLGFRAAMAAVCADEVGAFPEVHAVLFGRPDSIGKWTWSEVAAQAGVSDVEEFEDCVVSDRARNQVVLDTLVAHGLGITGTPAFLINGRFVQGFQGAAVMDSLVLSALNDARRPIGR